MATAQSQDFDALRATSAIIKGVSRNSLTRNAQDSMCLFPAVSSQDFLIEDSIPFFKEVERYYASLLVAVISGQSDYNMARYANPMDYIKKFHNNENANPILRALDGDLSLPQDVTWTAIESASLIPDTVASQIAPDFVMECMLGTEDIYNAGSLNDVYAPHGATQKVMESLVSSLRSVHKPAMETAGTPATEAISKMEEIRRRMDAGRKPVDDNQLGGISASAKSTTTKVLTKDRVVNGQVVLGPDGNPSQVPITDAKGNPVVARDETPQITRATGKQAVVRVDRINSMEPTMISLQLTGHKSGGIVITHNVVVGVKVNVRSCPSDVMVANLTKAVSGSRAIFTFIKWTQGNYKFIRDFVFGVASAKDATLGGNDARNWLAKAKRSKIKGMIAKLTDQSCPPIMTICCTSHEVAQVAEATGVDLNDAYAVIKMMNTYYLLAFAIVDPATGRVRILFDGDTNYSELSLNVLRGRSTNKETDLTQYVSILRAAGGLR